MNEVRVFWKNKKIKSIDLNNKIFLKNSQEKISELGTFKESQDFLEKICGKILF